VFGRICATRFDKRFLLEDRVDRLAAFGLTRLIASQLYGVTPMDPLTIAVVVLLLTAVALLACVIPARHAAEVDPLRALRVE
jgi:putative ABC transport system permease protein